MTQRICSVEGCDATVVARLLCNRHYLRFRKYGDPLGQAPAPLPMEERFWAQVEKSSGCWLWTGRKLATGYGVIARGKGQGNVLAHRYAYELAAGQIPVGTEIDHKCHTRNCVRPDHLQATSHQANAENRAGARAGSVSGVRGVTYCPKRGRYYVRAFVAGKTHCGGGYATLEEARAAAIELRNRVMRNNLADREGRRTAP